MKNIAYIFFVLFAILCCASADSSRYVDTSSQVFALSNFDKKLLENGSLQGYVVSEKLDGVRALWDGENLKSRSGKAFSPPKCWVENLPDFALDGELFIARGKFEEVLSIVSKGDSKCEECKCEEWRKVGYFIFDVPQSSADSNTDSSTNQKSALSENAKDSAKYSIDSSAKSYTLLERLALLEKWLENSASKTNHTSKANHTNKTKKENQANKTNKAEIPKNIAGLTTKQGKNPILHIIPQESVPSLEALQIKLKEIEKLGGEGLVIRKNSAPYERFRTTNAMKLKSYNDTECVVVAHNQGKGKFSNALGSLTCESLPLDFTKDAKNTDSTHSASMTSATYTNSIADSLALPTHSRKIRFKIGSGFSDKDRASPPPIGSTITYKYYGLTKNGLPRFPIFLRIHSP